MLTPLLLVIYYATTPSSYRRISRAAPDIVALELRFSEQLLRGPSEDMKPLMIDCCTPEGWPCQETNRVPLNRCRFFHLLMSQPVPVQVF